MYLTLLALPLATYATISLFGRQIGPRGTIFLSVFSSGCCALISFQIFYQIALCTTTCLIPLGDYFNCGLFDAQWGLLFDTLTAVMCLVVTLISFLVVVYSTSYMIADPHFIRFISYLKLFTVAMLILVTADNYIQLFVGWELVGLASFLLISFWFTRLQAGKSAIQAMLLNRVGDIGLALGIIALFFCYESTNYHALFCVHNNTNYEALDSVLGINLHDAACILLFIGAMGKSGQFILHAWLPNAMNAPTPVSALLHAATMVTAGVFLLARTSPLLENAPTACSVITIIGAITTLFAGSIGLVQNDFKSIIAYSTCSQLGYMITVCGLNNYHVGIFHLYTHSFFKALLFLTAGAVIHSLSDLQDVRKYGGLQQVMLFSYTALLIGTLALIGTPFLTGFYSKDVILECACAKYSLTANFGYILTLFSVLTTSYYSFRLLYMTFHTVGTKVINCDRPTIEKVHDADIIMIVVLTVLAIGSIYVGWFFKPMFIGVGTDFWNNSIAFGINSGYVEAEFLPVTSKLLPLWATLSGGILAYLTTGVFISSAYTYTLKYLRPVYIFLNQRWHYDKVLNTFIAMPGYQLGFTFVKVFDKGLLELLPIFGALPTSLKYLYIKCGETQSGLIYHYAAIMIFTALCSLTLLSYDTVNWFVDARLSLIMATILLVV